MYKCWSSVVFNSDKLSLVYFRELPYECPMKMVTAKMWGPYLIVNSIFGVEITCDPENLKVILDGQHLNNTIGLLGTSDGDLGTDMRLSDGTFAANKAEFINHFELSRKKICQVTAEQLRPKSQTSKCSDEIRKRCMETFASYKSPFLKCFLTVNPKYFLVCKAFFVFMYIDGFLSFF